MSKCCSRSTLPCCGPPFHHEEFSALVDDVSYAFSFGFVGVGKCYRSCIRRLSEEKVCLLRLPCFWNSTRPSLMVRESS